MASYEGISKNFRFMVMEVTKQVEHTVKLLDGLDTALIGSIQDSDNYIDTQKSLIEQECFSFVAQLGETDAKLVDSVRAVHTIANNLERIADFSVNIAEQFQALSEVEVLRRYDYCAYFDRLLDGLDLAPRALFKRDTSMALRICHLDEKLDRLYRSDRERIICELPQASDAAPLVTVLFILHYVERMGDALLNIGEAIIFAVLGERLKIHQYRVLEDAVASSQSPSPSMADLELESIWGTRSGVRIGTMEHQQAESGRRLLFKEGNPDKLKKEHDSLLRWSKIAPGLAPEVIEYQQADRGAALLLQYMHGKTLQDVAVAGNADEMQAALRCVEAMLSKVWASTRREAPTNARYLRQLSERLPDVYRVHPGFRDGPFGIGRLSVPSFDALLDNTMPIDEALGAPFTVLAHGDFNLDNVIYHRKSDSLHFVDVHRSRDTDYVQDVSVHLVSAFRIPVFVSDVRRRLEAFSMGFLRFARAFARERGDATFEVRLALGLVRSFTTSTRFELNEDFAGQMHQRSIMLLNKLHAHNGSDWATFSVPDEVLVY